MSQRLRGAPLPVLVMLAVLVAALGAVTSPALATEAPAGGEAEAEEGGEAINIDALRDDPVSRQFVPEEQEPPAFFRFINLPLVVAGVVVVVLLLLSYLLWQPRFAEERRSRRRR